VARNPVTNSFVIDRLRVDGGLSFGTFNRLLADRKFRRRNSCGAATTQVFSRSGDAATHTYTKAFNSDFDQFSFGFLYMLKNAEREVCGRFIARRRRLFSP